jgi:choline dehydrogenase-like flavoprotein
MPTIVVGAGASAVAAALQLTDMGEVPLILDVGQGPAPEQPTPHHENLYDIRRSVNAFQLLIGPTYFGLKNLASGQNVPAKLTSPHVEYVTRKTSSLHPVVSQGFSPIRSYARGGLANVWGAGLYRFTERDLLGFPFGATALHRYFDRLTGEIGICGEDDDLSPFFGPAEGLMPGLKLSRNATCLYKRYQGTSGPILLGRPRLGVLTQAFQGRPAFDYSSTEFWRENPSIYNPRFTLDRLISEGKVDYRPGLLVERWTDSTSGAEVWAKKLDTGERVSFRTERLLLAAGAINTGALVLRSRPTAERLPLLENPALQIPLVLPEKIGYPLDTRAFSLAQLNLIWDSEEFGALLQGSLMELTGPRRADLYGSLPLSCRANLSLLKYLVPAMMVLQLYLPASRPAELWLDPDGAIRIQAEAEPIPLTPLRRLFTFLLRLGLLSHPSLVVQVPLGHAIHYAGTIPMKENGGPYTCNMQGKLNGSSAVYIVDSASFPALPAKNMSFAMMANAMRVAEAAFRERKQS